MPSNMWLMGGRLSSVLHWATPISQSSSSRWKTVYGMQLYRSPQEQVPSYSSTNCMYFGRHLNLSRDESRRGMVCGHGLHVRVIFPVSAPSCLQDFTELSADAGQSGHDPDRCDASSSSSSTASAVSPTAPAITQSVPEFQPNPRTPIAPYGPPSYPVGAAKGS